MWHHVERMTHCRIKKHPPQTKRGGCFFVFGKNFNLMTLHTSLLFFCLSCQKNRAFFLPPAQNVEPAKIYVVLGGGTLYNFYIRAGGAGGAAADHSTT